MFYKSYESGLKGPHTKHKGNWSNIYTVANVRKYSWGHKYKLSGILRLFEEHELQKVSSKNPRQFKSAPKAKRVYKKKPKAIILPRAKSTRIRKKPVRFGNWVN